MMQKFLRTLFIMAVCALMMGVSAYATDYTEEGTYRWEIKDDLYYAYDAVTGELIRNCKVGKSYVNKKGTRYLNQFKKGVYYDGEGLADRHFKGGWIEVDEKFYYFRNKKKLKGYRKISGKNYYFSDEGERLSGIYSVKGKYLFFKPNGVQFKKSGWKTVSGKRYFVADGEIKEGFFTVNSKKYYQTVLDGILTGEQKIGEETYLFNEDGTIDESSTLNKDGSGVLGNESDILFFTKFESGSVGYAQTGGDNGKACGKYQFDYRYSLIPLLKYCYKADPVFFKEFKPFLKISPGSASLINNSKLYKAWADIYKEDPDKFSSMQDKYAIEAYYKPCENYLSAKGIKLSTRPYVIRGAVFSYAIQEGTVTAALGVIASGAKKAASDKEFLEKLYDYRWKDPKGWGRNSIFRYRYTQEKALALSLLPAASA